MPSYLALEHLHLAYPNGRSRWHSVVHDLDLSLEPGEIASLLGESGCGKTTILRAVAGLDIPRSGRIVLDGQELAGEGCFVPPEQRRIGMMFQDYALFPHLDIRANIGFGIRRLPAAQRAERIAEMARLVGLEHSLDKYPHELSGGQQQRIALARAMAPSPRLLLLDEPFSSLDIHTRERLAFEVRDILKETGTTALLVTHSQAEAFAISDSVGLMHEGRIVQWDTPYGLHHHPASDYVRRFIRHGDALEDRRNEIFRRARPDAAARESTNSILSSVDS